jgi:hypothetical protein
VLENSTRPFSIVAAVVLLSVAACTSAPIQAPVAGSLDGDWRWAGNCNPGGSWRTLTLSTEGILVSGTGVSEGAGPASVADSITIAGQLFTSGRFRLTLNFASGSVGAYSGELVAPNELQGAWTEAGQSYVVIFYRGDGCPGPP